MRASRIELAVSEGLFAKPAEGKIAVFRPNAGDDLSALGRGDVVIETGMKTDLEHFAAHGYDVSPCDTYAADSYAAAVVCLPRARDLGRALLAEASRKVVAGGPILVDGQKTEGVESALKELRGRVDLSTSLSKAHGKAAVFMAGADLSDWAARYHTVPGDFVTQPGVFSADGADPGSELLVANLPEKLGAKVIDLGAGWGYLSRAVLARATVKRLDVVEVERLALDCARQNLDDPRVAFHWQSALAFRPESLAQTVVMNPPFHTGRSAEPSLGIAFIAAARKMLTPDGALWMVANRHLPYDEALTEHFLEYETVAQTNAFRVVRAIKPRRASR